MPVDEKTREGTEGTARSVQAMHWDRCSPNRVQVCPTCSISFDVKTESSALPCRDDVLIENDAEVPKSCLSPLEMRTPTATGGLLPTGKPSTATRTTFDQPTLWFCLTEETNLRTSVLYNLYYSSFYVCYSLLPKGHRNRFRAKSDVRFWQFYRSSPHLPIFGNMALLMGRLSLGR